MPPRHTPGPWKTIKPRHGHPTECLSVQVGPDDTYTTLEMLPSDAKAVAAVPELIEAVSIAYQLAGIASDWNLNEVEIDGRMRPIHALENLFKKAYRKATGVNP